MQNYRKDFFQKMIIIDDNPGISRGGGADMRKVITDRRTLVARNECRRKGEMQRLLIRNLEIKWR